MLVSSARPALRAGRLARAICKSGRATDVVAAPRCSERRAASALSWLRSGLSKPEREAHSPWHSVRSTGAGRSAYLLLRRIFAGPVRAIVREPAPKHSICGGGQLGCGRGRPSRHLFVCARYQPNSGYLMRAFIAGERGSQTIAKRRSSTMLLELKHLRPNAGARRHNNAEGWIALRARTFNRRPPSRVHDGSQAGRQAGTQWPRLAQTTNTYSRPSSPIGGSKESLQKRLSERLLAIAKLRLAHRNRSTCRSSAMEPHCKQPR